METMSSPTDQKKPNREAKADNLGQILSKYKGLDDVEKEHQKAFVEAVVNFLGADGNADSNAEDNDNAYTKGHVSVSDGAREIINESQCDKEVLLDLLHVKAYLKHRLDIAQAKVGSTGNIDFYQVFRIPFFAGPLPLPSLEDDSSNNKKQQKPSKMSRAVASRLERRVFKGRNPVYFDIDFDHWDHQHSNNNLPAISGNDVVTGKVINGYNRILQDSWKMGRGGNESNQLRDLMDLITPSLEKLGGFKGGLENNPDFHFSNNGNKFLYGEGKDLKNLPLYPPKDQLSYKLCIFGFATVLASEVYKDGEANEYAKQLTADMKLKPRGKKKKKLGTVSEDQALGGGNPNPGAEENVKTDGSDTKKVAMPTEKLPSSILDRSYEGLRPILYEVNDSLKRGLIQPHDALNLWMAVMQACIKSITHKKKFTMVVSQRVAWYVELIIEEGRYIIAISDGRAVGNEDFILDLAKFLTFVNAKEDMEDHEMEQWTKNWETADTKLAAKTDPVPSNNDGSGSGGGGSGSGHDDKSNKRKKDDDHSPDHKRGRKDKDKYDQNGTGQIGDGKGGTDTEVATANEILTTSEPTTVLNTTSGHDITRPSLVSRAVSCDDCDPSDNDYAIPMNNKCTGVLGAESPKSKQPQDGKESSGCKTRADMSDLDQMMWQRALMHFPHFEDAGSFSTLHPPTPEEEHFFPGQEQEGISNSPTKRTLASPKEPNVPQHRNVNVGNTHILGVDKYGPVPYLCSLTNIVRDIGYGRCGTVNEIIWDNGQSVAMKVYDLQDSDDHRDPYDVFLHERNTLFEMHAQKELKGCVPDLIFHNPWWGCPSLGMELGRPVIEGDDEKWDDIDAWDEKDKIMLQDTLDKLEKHGWVQLDHRGCNYVRLTKEDGSESIATIDIESVYRVDDPEKPFFLNVRF